MKKMMIPLTRYAQFSGRAGRAEFWWFQLFILILMIPVYVLGFIAGLNNSSMLAMLAGGLNLVVSLGLIVPALAVGVRRLHDTGRSGWWYLLAFVPLANLALLVFALQPGTPGDNRFGTPAPQV